MEVFLSLLQTYLIYWILSHDGAFCIEEYEQIEVEEGQAFAQENAVPSPLEYYYLTKKNFLHKL